MRLISRSLYAEVGKYPGITREKVGQRLCMSVCLTYVTGAAQFRTTIKIAICGCAVEVCYVLKGSSLVPG